MQILTFHAACYDMHMQLAGVGDAAFPALEVLAWSD
jgi:hypothetical protein